MSAKYIPKPLPESAYENKDFKLVHVKFIYDRALNYQELRDQWVRPGMLDYQRGAEYDAKLEACIELLENILVFSVGNGIDPHEGYPRPPNNFTNDARLASIGRIFDVKAKPQKRSKKAA